MGSLCSLGSLPQGKRQPRKVGAWRGREERLPFQITPTPISWRERGVCL